MGHRFEVYTDQETAQEVIKISKTFNVDAQIIGRCEASEAKRVTVKSEHGEFNY
jgi:phosphoribosylformylglycinamidine cyclo-ligase